MLVHVRVVGSESNVNGGWVHDHWHLRGLSNVLINFGCIARKVASEGVRLAHAVGAHGGNAVCACSVRTLWVCVCVCVCSCGAQTTPSTPAICCGMLFACILCSICIWDLVQAPIVTVPL